jgi:hypothetical protein
VKTKHELGEKLGETEIVLHIGPAKGGSWKIIK